MLVEVLNKTIAGLSGLGVDTTAARVSGVSVDYRGVLHIDGRCKAANGRSTPSPPP